MPFLGRANVCANGYAQHSHFCVSFRVTCWMFIILWFTCFCSSYLFFSNSASTSKIVSVASGVQFHSDFLFPDMVLLLILCPVIGPFYFQISELPLSCSRVWSGSMCKIDIILQELRTVLLMLQRMAFDLLCKVVSVHLDNSTIKAYLCNPRWYSFTFFFAAFHILNLADKDGITLYSSIHTYPSQDGSQLSIAEKVGSRTASSSSHGWSSVLPLG